MAKTSSVNMPSYNAETLSAIRETEDIISGRINAKSYSSLQEIVDEIEAEGLGE